MAHADAKHCYEKLKVATENTFTLHGLWPGLMNGKMIPECTGGVKIDPNSSPVYQVMNHVWPSLTNSNEEFWEHEYNKHGYCYAVHTKTSNDPTRFFQKTLDLFATFSDLYSKLKAPADHK